MKEKSAKTKRVVTQKSDECHCDNGNTFSVRRKVLDFWMKNQHLTAKPTCEMLDIDYKKHGNYVKRLLCDFRRNPKFGRPLKAQLHRRVFVWECVSRELLFGRFPALRSGFVSVFGWKAVANRNGMLVFRDDVLGSVEWFVNGRVLLFLRGSLLLAHAKELFCKAFCWFTPQEWATYLDVPLREESRHWVFEVGKPLPRFEIRQFERTHGLKLYSDGSHPTAVEIEETRPFWLDQWEDVTRRFGDNIEAHLNLIETWKKEAESRVLRTNYDRETLWNQAYSIQIDSGLNASAKASLLTALICSA
jgi:hypothetical protein